MTREDGVDKEEPDGAGPSRSNRSRKVKKPLRKKGTKRKGKRRSRKTGAETPKARKVKRKTVVPSREEMVQNLRTQYRRTVPNFIAGLVIFLGLLNFLSIILPIFTEALSLPSVTFLPVEFAEAGDVIHAVVGLLLIYLGYHLYRRRRGAWTVILLFLFLSLIASVLSIEKPASIATAALTLYLMFMLYLYRDQFSSPSVFSLSAKRMSAVLFGIVMVIYGIVGSKTLGREFDSPIETWTDAVYFTITTMTTVGFGDHTPITENARWFTIVLMVLGFTAFLVLIGTLLGPYIEERFQRVIRMVGGIRTERLANHLIVCGLSTEGRILIESLKERDILFVVVCRSEERHQDLLSEGVSLVSGDPSESEILERVGVKKAKALIACSDDDALNAFITVTARDLNPDLPVISMASSRENMQKLRSVGATKVISPSVIGAERLLGAAVGDEIDIRMKR